MSYMQTASSGPCGSCQGRGVIMQDVGLTDELAHPCPMGCRPGSRSAPASASAGMPVGAAELQQLLARRPGRSDRYCNICQDPATRDDLLPNRSTIHQARICALWRPETRIDEISEGAVIGYYRLLNREAPVVVEGLIPLEMSPRPRAVLYLRHVRWVADDRGLLRFTADGPLTERTVDQVDLVNLADPRIRDLAVEASRVPPAWLSITEFWGSMINVAGAR